MVEFMSGKFYLAFITTNKHKFEEVREVLAGFPVELEWVRDSYPEDHDATLEEIAMAGAKALAERLNRAVVVEDTGLFFSAFSGFPGTLPKFVFNTLGYYGIMKLLEGEKRGAYFKTVAAIALPAGEVKLFEGIMKGTITAEVFDKDKDAMPYDRIFIPDGKDIVISRMSMEEKNSFSQRAQAFRALGDYIAGIK